MPSRFEKFSERARRVLSLAQEEAQRFNHNYIGTEHILLGLVRESEGVAAKVLSNLNVELVKVRSAVEFIIGRGERPTPGEIGLALQIGIPLVKEYLAVYQQNDTSFCRQRLAEQTARLSETPLQLKRGPQ